MRKSPDQLSEERRRFLKLVYHDPEILILDEATSALDSESVVEIH